MSKIHPTAIIEDGAKLGNDVEVGPYAVVGPNVELADGCKVFGHAMISGYTKLGAQSEVHPFAHIGGKTQDLKFDGGINYVEIGERTVLREYVTVNAGTAGGEVTKIGNDCLLMAYCHVAHGCVLGNRVIVSNGTHFAGEAMVDDYATISGLCGVHQFCRIGRHCMVGIGTLVTQDIAPYFITTGNPPSINTINIVGLKRHGISEESRGALKSAYKLLCRSGMNVSEALAEIEATLPQNAEIAHLVDFFKTTKRGVIR